MPVPSPNLPSAPLRFATVDIGTNTVLLVVAEAGGLESGYEQKQFVRLAGTPQVRRRERGLGPEGS